MDVGKPTNSDWALGRIASKKVGRSGSSPLTHSHTGDRRKRKNITYAEAVAE